MNTVLPNRTRRALDWITVLGRWFLGAYFIQMGVTKILDPVLFLKLLRQYQFITSPLLMNSIAAALPWFEIVCGLLLVLGVAVRGAALNIVAMLIPFTFVVTRRAIAVAAAQGLPFCAVRFDCGCGGGEVVICQKLVENACLIFLACWLLSGRGRQLAARFSLFGAGSPKTPLPSQLQPAQS